MIKYGFKGQVICMCLALRHYVTEAGLFTDSRHTGTLLHGIQNGLAHVNSATEASWFTRSGHLRTLVTQPGDLKMHVSQRSTTVTFAPIMLF